jgi:hypothetical protein
MPELRRRGDMKIILIFGTAPIKNNIIEFQLASFDKKKGAAIFWQAPFG